MVKLFQLRRWFFDHTSRFWRNLVVEMFPGTLTCTMALVLAYAMYLSKQLCLRYWLAVIAYGMVGVWLFSSAVLRIYADNRDERQSERFAKGLCNGCGFDLRSCTTVRCSECGAWHGKLPMRAWGRRGRNGV